MFDSGMIHDWGVIVVAVVGAFITYIRMETSLKSRLEAVEKDILAHKEEVKDKDLIIWGKIDALQSSMNEVLRAVVKLETILEYKKEKQ